MRLPGPTQILIGSDPALAIFKDRLYVAFKAADSPTLWVNSSADGLNFDQHSAYASPGPSQILIDGSPALAVFNDRLYVAFRAADGPSLWINSSPDGVTFDRHTSYAAPGPSQILIGGSPALAVFKDRLYIAFKVADGPALWINSSADGLNFDQHSAYAGLGPTQILIGGDPAIVLYTAVVSAEISAALQRNGQALEDRVRSMTPTQLAALQQQCLRNATILASASAANALVEGPQASLLAALLTLIGFAATDAACQSAIQAACDSVSSAPAGAEPDPEPGPVIDLDPDRDPNLRQNPDEDPSTESAPRSDPETRPDPDREPAPRPDPEPGPDPDREPAPNSDREAAPDRESERDE